MDINSANFGTQRSLPALEFSSNSQVTTGFAQKMGATGNGTVGFLQFCAWECRCRLAVWRKPRENSAKCHTAPTAKDGGLTAS
jgi:hypothetical protein